jgi:hypothetical protein
MLSQAARIVKIQNEEFEDQFGDAQNGRTAKTPRPQRKRSGLGDLGGCAVSYLFPCEVNCKKILTHS